MKKILMFTCLTLVYIILMSSTISAFEFDNIKQYDFETKTVTIKNSILGIPWLDLDTVATARLITPQVNHVIKGKNRRVMIFEVENFEGDYKDALKELEFYNLKENGKEETKKFSYEYAIYGDVVINDYEYVCELDPQSQNGSSICEYLLVGNHIENRIIRWEKLKDKDLPGGNITIALVTNVKEKDHYDGIPTLFGIRVPEWAEWTESFNVGLVSYYDFENNADKVAGAHNMTLSGDSQILFTLTNSFNNNSGEFNLTASMDLQNTDSANEWEWNRDTTVSSWLRREYAAPNQDQIFGKRTGGVGWYILDFGPVQTGAVTPVASDYGSSLTLNTWEHYVLTQNSSHFCQWKNGALVVTSCQAVGATGTGATDATFGQSQAGAENFEGRMDEIAYWNRSLSASEISDLYNGGSGIFYTTDFSEIPVVTLNSPAADLVTTNGTIDFNCSATDDVEIVNVTLFIDGVANFTQAGTGTNFTELTQTITFPDGNYNWTCRAVDDEDLNGTTVTRDFSIDTTLPAITIINPNATLNYSAIGKNETLNWSVTDLNLDSLWYNYNGTNITVFGAQNSTQFVLVNKLNLTFYANDSLGNLNSQLVNWSYFVFETGRSFEPIVSEGEEQTLLLNVTLDPSFSLSNVELNYNGTNFSSSASQLSAFDFEISNDITTPAVDANANVTFFWIFDNGVTVITDSDNQSVNNLLIDDCSAGSVIIFNLTLKDEESQEVLNGTLQNSSIEVDVDLFPVGSSSAVQSFSKNYSSTNNALVCLNTNLTDNKYFIDALFRYTSDSYAAEFYNIQNLTIINSTLPQVIDLFDLLTEDSTKFLITYRDENFLPVENALIQIQRKYVSEGVFKTVEIPKTDVDGQAVGHFDTDSVLYTLVVTKNGLTLGTFDNIAVICQDEIIGDCKININSFTSGTAFTDYSTVDNLNFRTTFNEGSRTITTTFSTIDGSVTTFLGNATLFDSLGNTSVCSDSLTTSSGTLTCSIPDSFGNTTVLYQTFKDDEFVTQNTYSIESNEAFNGDGPILSILLLLTIPFFLIANTIGFIVVTIISLVLVGGILLIETGSLLGPSSIIIWAVVTGGIIIIRIVNKTN